MFKVYLTLCNIFPLGGLQGMQHPTVPNVQYGVLRPLHAPWRKKNSYPKRVFDPT